VNDAVMAQAPVGGTRKSIRVILEVYVETHPFSKSRGGGGDELAFCRNKF